MQKISCFFLILIPFLSFNQTILTGEISDSVSGNAIEYASFKLFSSKDSVLRTGAYTDEKGKFIIENIKSGTYYGVISFSGYEDRYINSINLTGQPTFNIGKIKLQTIQIQNIEDVVIEGKLETLKAGIDKKIYNVDQDISSRGAGADEVLNNIPSITLDEDGRVSLRGDGSVTILIDGQPSNMTGEGGNFLSSIPASSIERIEVVTNPSAKYSPDGTSGIINIVLKKNKLKGINGQVSGSGGIPGNDHKLNAALSFRNDKVNIYGSYGFNFMQGYRNNYSSIDRKLSDTSFMKLDQTREGNHLKRGHVARVGLDWYVNNNNTLGFFVNGQLNADRRGGDQMNTQYISSDLVTNRWVRKSFEPEDRKGIDANLFYNHNLKDETGKLSSNVYYSLSNRLEKGNFEQYYDIENGIYSNLNSSYKQQSANNDKGILTAQVDFERVIARIKARYEVGMKGSFSNEYLVSNSTNYDFSLNEMVPDTFAIYNYKYREDVYSAYGVFGQELGKIKYQIGLRAEYALQDPKLATSSQNYKKEYFQLYPSAHIRYEVAKNGEISLGYSRRINRPQSWNLNPFAIYSDPFNLRMGNPDLKPEYIHSVDLGYTQTMKIVSITASVYYRYTSDVISRVKTFIDNNTAAVTMANISNSQTTGGELVFQIRPTSWWRNTLSLNGNYIDFRSKSADLNNKGFNWGLKYTGSFDFWKKTATVQLNAVYNAPRVTPQGKVFTWNFVDISVQKNFFNKKLTIGLKLADVFNTKNFRMKIDRADLQQTSKFDFQTRRVYLTLTYKFGKLEFSQKQLPKENEGGGGDF
ncbi:MAG: TonB-dependent receptor [Crocinitomicaceae bacterium]|nr:TonB-dependent receptor [Crocinitomicaceae bacterium]